MSLGFQQPAYDVQSREGQGTEGPDDISDLILQQRKVFLQWVVANSEIHNPQSVESE